MISFDYFFVISTNSSLCFLHQYYPRSIIILQYHYWILNLRLQLWHCCWALAYLICLTISSEFLTGQLNNCLIGTMAGCCSLFSCELHATSVDLCLKIRPFLRCTRINWLILAVLVADYYLPHLCHSLWDLNCRHPRGPSQRICHRSQFALCSIYWVKRRHGCDIWDLYLFLFSSIFNYCSPETVLRMCYWWP